MTRVGVLSQARMTSTRLPGKVLMQAAGKPFLQHHVERLRSSGLELIVATTTNDTDTPIVERCARWGVPTYRGPEDDVLARFAGAAREFELDAVVRVTSDCPLIDGAVVRHGVDQYLRAESDATYVSNTLTRTFPRGFDFEAFSAAALFEADQRATSARHREHVTPYLYENPGNTGTLINVPWHEDKSAYRLTLDTAEDRRLLTALFDDHNAADLSCAEIIALLDQRPDLVAINASVEQKKA